MEAMKINNQNHHESFLSSSKPHIVMIGNHSIHRWDLIPGLPDTGGQNIFINQMTEALSDEGFRITIVNRGGFACPVTGEMRGGLVYRNDSMRIFYLRDSVEAFVRKEDMHEHIHELTLGLKEFLDDESISVDLLVSHYWDGGLIGVRLNEIMEKRAVHVWVPHSLGTVKSRRMTGSAGSLRLDERIRAEKEIIARVDKIADTSSVIQTSLKDDYRFEGTSLFLPPCIDTDRFHSREVPADHPVWQFLAGSLPVSPEEVRNYAIITEVSRTDRTKQKDVLIRAFAPVLKEYPRALLVLSIDRNNPSLSEELESLIRELGIRDNTVIVGSIMDILPDIYAVSRIYCTPSIMEGFGMSAQEAAATRVPVIASNLVPFVDEYLMGREREFLTVGGRTITIGSGAVQVAAGDIQGFTEAMKLLLGNELLRRTMGESAYQATIPYFTWKRVIEEFLCATGLRYS